MQKIDVINSTLELVAVYMVWKDVFALIKAKCIRGVFWPRTLWFTGYGFWALYYYAQVEHWVSLSVGCFVVAGNFTWSVLAVRIALKGKA